MLAVVGFRGRGDYWMKFATGSWKLQENTA